jgi:hypothetical protein
MKHLILVQTLILILSFSFYTASANEVAFCNPNIPATQWEQHPGGIATAIILSRDTDKNGDHHIASVYIKNDSKKAVAYSRNEADSGINLLYISSKNIKVPLHNYTSSFDLYGGSRLSDITIKPGSTLLITINLTSSDVALLGKNRCQYALNTIDPSTGASTAIESSPKQLTEVVASSSVESK